MIAENLNYVGDVRPPPNMHELMLHDLLVALFNRRSKSQLK